MSNKRPALGGGANNITEKTTPSTAFVQQEETKLNVVEESKTKSNKEKRLFFGVRLTPKEYNYLEKMKDRHQISGGAAFHLVLSEYMRSHPL